MCDQEENIFSDSSLELFDTFNIKTKQKVKCLKKSNFNVMVDQIDVAHDSCTELEDFKSKIIKTKSSSNRIIDNSSLSNKSFSSNESFKSIYSSECNNDINSVLVNEKNKFSTPEKQHTQTNSPLILESAKLLDRIYGKQWRNIDGVIKNYKTTYMSDELFQSPVECDRKISNSNDSNTNDNTSSHKKTSRKISQKMDILPDLNDASIILGNISLSNNSINVIDELKNNNSTVELDDKTNLKSSSQQSTNKCKSKYQSKIPIKSKVEAKLSFLSSLSCFTGSMKSDPKAEKYKLKFKKTKDDLVSVLFMLFNEEVFDNKLPPDMNIKWNARLRSTAGACFNKRTVKINQNLDCERISRIELSSKIIDTAERLRDTLIHELCHAACWIFDGISEGHGPSWKNWANKAMKKFPELPIIKRCHSYDIQTKFTYKCIKCGYSFGRHSKSLNLERKRCGYCLGEFELIVNQMNNNAVGNKLPVVYTDPLKELYNLDTDYQKPKLPRKPSIFALFVKENYSRVKRENVLLKHGEIMKILGSEYATTKILTPDEIFNKLLDS